MLTFLTPQVPHLRAIPLQTSKPRLVRLLVRSCKITYTRMSTMERTPMAPWKDECGISPTSLRLPRGSNSRGEMW